MKKKSGLLLGSQKDSIMAFIVNHAAEISARNFSRRELAAALAEMPSCDTHFAVDARTLSAYFSRIYRDTWEHWGISLRDLGKCPTR